MEPLQRKSDHVYISVRLSLKSKLDACNYKESKRLSFFCSFLSDETCMFTGNSVRAFEFCLLVSVCLSVCLIKRVSFWRNYGAASVEVLQHDLVLSTGLIMWIRHRKEIRNWIRSDEGLTLETATSESLYGGQFTLSTQSIKPNCLSTVCVSDSFRHPYIFSSKRISSRSMLLWLVFYLKTMAFWLETTNCKSRVNVSKSHLRFTQKVEFHSCNVSAGLVNCTRFYLRSAEEDV